MKEVTITITATVPDEATEDELGFIAGAAYVQVAEPVDEFGDDLLWSGPSAVNYTMTVEETS
jgi:hypothetical protein